MAIIEKEKATRIKFLKSLNEILRILFSAVVFEIENGIADELVVVIEQVKRTGIIKDYSPIFGGGRQSFKGKDLVDWLMAAKQIS